MITKGIVRKNISIELSRDYLIQFKITREYNFGCGSGYETVRPPIKSGEYISFYTKIAEAILEKYPEINEGDRLVIGHHYDHEGHGAEFVVLLIGEWEGTRQLMKKKPIYTNYY